MSFWSNFSQESQDWLNGLVNHLSHPSAAGAIAEITSAKQVADETVKSALATQTEIESFLPVVTGALSLVPNGAAIAASINGADAALKAVENAAGINENPNQPAAQ